MLHTTGQLATFAIAGYVRATSCRSRASRFEQHRSSRNGESASKRRGMIRRSLRPLPFAACSLFVPLSCRMTGANAGMCVSSPALTKMLFPASYESSRTKNVRTLPRGTTKLVSTPSMGSSTRLPLFLLLDTFLKAQKRVSLFVSPWSSTV